MAEAYILMKVRMGCEREAVAKLKEIKEISDLNELYGDWDIIAKVKVEKIEELDKLITEKIRSTKEIKLTSTMIVANYIR